jgi:type VI secretion system protein ImpE
MSAMDSLRQGNLTQALEELQNEVRQDPADVKLRVFLFQLLAIAGSWDRAMTQLNLAGEMDAGTLAMVQVYRQALAAEAIRHEVFAGHQSPMVFGEPQEWIARLAQSLALTAQGNGAAARELRVRALDEAPASVGTINERPFAWIADADARLGPILEVILNGGYYWIPFMRIKSMMMEEPADLRDLVWLPAQFTWSNGGEAFGLIPARYPDSHQSAMDAIRLGRRTEWLDQGNDLFVGMGQRMLATDTEEYPLMDIRRIVIEDLSISGE